MKNTPKKNNLFLIFYCTCLLAFLSNCSKDEISEVEFNSIKTENPGTDMLKSATTTISFSGYEWYVKDATAFGPGPNNWNPNNVWVDSDGKLHLTITYNSLTQKWDCAEVWSTTSMGFGKYEWFVEGRIDLLDKNVVFGLFNYPTASIGPDGTNEIDIEYSKWGDDASNIGNYVVWPAKLINRYTKWSASFPVSLTGTYTTQRFTWASNSVNFQSLHGWTTENNNLIFSKTYSQSNTKAKSYIPLKAEPVHMNLWLFRGNAPSNNTPVEVIIAKFKKY